MIHLSQRAKRKQRLLKEKVYQIIHSILMGNNFNLIQFASLTEKYNKL